MHKAPGLNQGQTLPFSQLNFPQESTFPRMLLAQLLSVQRLHTALGTGQESKLRAGADVGSVLVGSSMHWPLASLEVQKV